MWEGGDMIERVRHERKDGMRGRMWREMDERKKDMVRRAWETGRKGRWVGGSVQRRMDGMEDG